MPKEEPFDDEIKFRCYKALVARSVRLAKKARRKHADWLRLGMDDYLNIEEKKLGLPQITPKEIEVYLGSGAPESPKRN
jgi:hypothetical protein